MSITETNIANKSGTKHLGIPAIDDIDSTSNNVAKVFKANIEDARKIFLRDAAPGFARKELSLALAANETSEIYTYVYAYPSDCLKIREIWNGTTNDDPRIDFETGAHSSGTSEVILTDREDALLIYTRDITNYDMFAPDDIEAVAILLAWMSVMVLKRDKDLLARLERKYAIALGISKKNNKREQHVKLPDNNKYVNSRL
jgi:hypothetical protein